MGRLKVVRPSCIPGPTRPQEPNEPEPVAFPSSCSPLAYSSTIPFPCGGGAWRRPATCPTRRSGRCGAASSRRFHRLLPPPAPSPGWHIPGDH
nr:unnamed protein product [Digitaria exilis]